jgi:outer membrane protein OmpA-like peptidoglycan-associated protein
MFFPYLNRANLRIINKLAIFLVVFGGSFLSKISAQNDSLTSGKVELKVTNEATVNSDQLEFSPTFYEDGIVFSSTNPAGQKKIKDEKLKRLTTGILRSTRSAEGVLVAPVSFAKELSTPYNEGPVVFDRTGEVLFFSRNILKKGLQKRDKKGINRMAIYTSTKSGDKWSAPSELPFNTKAQWDDVHPCLSIDGDKLYFASNRPGGFGGMDIYVSFKNGEIWGEPINLGATINTAKNEVFPFIHADNTLYFGSNGHKGLGGLDMFFAQTEDLGWTAPVNLGAPFNSAGDDFGLIVDLDKINGYFSSNGFDGKGADDIYSFHTEYGNLDEYLLQNGRGSVKDLDVLVSVFNPAGDPIEGADIQIVSIERNNIIGKDSLGRNIVVSTVDGSEVMKVGGDLPEAKRGTTDTGGRFETTVKSGNYAIIISKIGFESRQITRQFTRTGNEIVVTLDQPKEGVHLLADLTNPFTGEPFAGAMLVLKDRASGETDTIYSDAKGRVDYNLAGGKNYDVTIFQGGVEVGKTNISTEKFKPGESGELSLKLDVQVTPLVTGNVIKLPNIYYNFNDASLRPDARKDLDAVAMLLKQYPSLIFELAAHTDSRGAAIYNDGLSQKRAENAADYLSKKSIPNDRLTAKGYGERQPVNRCEDGQTCSEKQHQQNRRTEIRIISGLQPGQVVVTGLQEKHSPSTKTEPIVVEKADKTPRAKPAPSKEATKVVNAAPAKNKTGTQMYAVIAGSFLMESRANKRLDQVKKLGFKEAKITAYADEAKDFVCVVVLETNSFDEAQAYATQLAAKNNMHTRVKTLKK